MNFINEKINADYLAIKPIYKVRNFCVDFSQNF